MLNPPAVIKSSDNKHSTAKINQTVTFWCVFSASTMKGVTEVVWIKDSEAISNSSHYLIVTHLNEDQPESTIKSYLTVSNITAEDTGVYSCYSYYNCEIVVCSQPVSSQHVHFTINKGTLLSLNQMCCPAFVRRQTAPLHCIYCCWHSRSSSVSCMLWICNFHDNFRDSSLLS